LTILNVTKHCDIRIGHYMGLYDYF